MVEHRAVICHVRSVEQLAEDLLDLCDAPADAGANNVYDLSFEAQDNDGAIATLALQITVAEAALKAGLPPSGNFELID